MLSNGATVAAPKFGQQILSLSSPLIDHWNLAGHIYYVNVIIKFGSAAFLEATSKIQVNCSNEHGVFGMR